MRNWITAMAFCIGAFASTAQLNLTQVGYLDINTPHSTGLNDIWGYVDTAGNEYALVGGTEGVSVVDISDPTLPVEVFWQQGLNSVWRDIKTWNKHAYITTEAQEGLLILDLSSLPDASGIDTLHWYGPVGGTDSLLSAHNLFIDSVGRCYIFGSNIGQGGVRILDLNADPKNPVEIKSFENWYVHDGMALGDTMYLGHINNGFMSMVDVGQTTPNLLGTAGTPGNFTHNVWISDDRNYAYTTDEIVDGFIGAYDISDPGNIIELDKIQSSPGDKTIPHNAHFIDNYIVTSYYTDGVVIHDVSNPSNMIEVANFDSSPSFGSSFDGCWGAYPWLPSGLIIISDREEGLFVLQPNYVRGCYLEGQVTDQVTGSPIPNAEITFLTENITADSDLSGNYETGFGVAGSYDIVYKKPGYFPDTVQAIVLTNGNITIQDVQLVPKIPFTMVVQLRNVSTLTPIANGKVHIFNQDFDFNEVTDANGYASITPFYEDFYDLVGGNWGNINKCVSLDYYDAVNDTVIIDLETGYSDDFALDLDWTSTALAVTGNFERAVPVSTGNGDVNPGIDADFDCYNYCYITGNGGQGSDFDDIDMGFTEITSPVMDLSGYTDPYVNYAIWFFNKFGPSAPDDQAIVYLVDNNNVFYPLDTMTDVDSMSAWIDKSFRVLDFVTTTNNLRLHVFASDLGTVNITECGFDRFLVSEGNVLGIETADQVSVSIYPNPSEGRFYIDIPEGASYDIVDTRGRVVVTRSDIRDINIETEPNGIYFVRILVKDQIKVARLVKI